MLSHEELAVERRASLARQAAARQKAEDEYRAGRRGGPPVVRSWRDRFNPQLTPGRLKRMMTETDYLPPREFDTVGKH